MAIISSRKLWTPSAALYVPAAGGAFTPLSLPNLIAWFKADAGVYVDAGTTLATNGQTVQQWNDNSGVGNAIQQASSVLRPTYQTNQLNGLPAILTDGSGIRGLRSASLSVSLGGTVCSVFIVVKWTVADSSGRIVSIASSGGGDVSTDGFTLFEPTSLTSVQTYNSGVKSSGTVVANSWNQIGTIFDGVNNTVYIGGVAQTPVAAAPTFASSVGIGIGMSGDGDSASLTAQVAEVVITKSALGSLDLSNLNTYLFGRWGV